MSQVLAGLADKIEDKRFEEGKGSSLQDIRRMVDQDSLAADNMACQRAELARL